MLKRRLIPSACVLASCLVASGCARSGLDARAAVDAPPPATRTSEVVVVFDEDSVDVVPEDVPPFQFPDDRGGALLSKLLAPDVPHEPVGQATQPRRSGPNGVETPDLLPPVAPAPLPRLPLAKGNSPLRPRLVLPETLDGPTLEALPSAPPLPAGELTRVPSVDVNQPVPLPLLGQPLSDRAPIEDVTAEASSAAVVAGPVPQRTAPAPFVKNNLPDPFEFRRPVGPTASPAEQPIPPSALPRQVKP